MQDHLQAHVLAGDVVMLRAGGLQLLVYQAEIETNDFLQQHLMPYQQDFLILSDAVLHAKPQLYIAIDEHMGSQQTSAQRFLLTKFFGCDWLWCWDDVRIMLDVKLPIRPLPARALAENSPLLGWVELDAPTFITSAPLLIDYLENNLRGAHV